MSDYDISQFREILRPPPKLIVELSDYPGFSFVVPDGTPESEICSALGAFKRAMKAHITRQEMKTELGEI